MVAIEIKSYLKIFIVFLGIECYIITDLWLYKI